MRRLLLPALLLASTPACMTAPMEDERDDSSAFEFEPGLFVSLADPGKADLPNRAFEARTLDTHGYRQIAERWVEAGVDVVPTGTPASYVWPLSDSHSVLSRQGTPIRLDHLVYEHTGVDVIRNSEAESSIVFAPTSGSGMITDWFGGQDYPYGDYSTVISVWDPDTHLLTLLMHVAPEAGLPRGEVFAIERGQPLGTLAAIDIPGGQHVHVNVIDAAHFALIDPSTVFLSYVDTTPPIIGAAYLLDESTARHELLQTGPLDIVVTAHDRDDSSPRNLEIESIAFVARDQLGTELARIDRCRLGDAFATLASDWSESAATIRLIDFGNATDQVSGFWPNSDVGNPDRLFRYALTNLRKLDGQCAVVARDRDGQIVITDEVTTLTVDVELWDSRNNHASTQFTFAR